MSNLKLKFSSFKPVSSHIVYHIDVTDNLAKSSYQLSHRYSFLRTIHSSLKKYAADLQFPSKKLICNRNPKFLEKRRAGLEKYFTEVLTRPFLTKLLYDLKFLKKEAAVEINDCKEEDFMLCKSCVKEVCISISTGISEKLIDMSCHPGSLNEEEIVDHVLNLKERCKDVKCGGGFSAPNVNLEGSEQSGLVVRECGRWAEAKFLDCLKCF